MELFVGPRLCLWAMDTSNAITYTHLSDLNITGSGWTNPAGPSGKTALAIDVGLDEVYYVATVGRGGGASCSWVVESVGG